MRLAASAFGGETNLHEHSKLIERLSQVYERLREEAREQGLL